MQRQPNSNPKEGARAAPEWVSRPERSNVTAIRFIAWLALTLGRPVARLALHPICVYFLLSSAEARAASRKYLHKAQGRKPGLSDLYQHYHAFASTILDRVFLLNGQFGMLDVRVHGVEIANEMIAHGQGCFLLGAHLGSFEIIRALGREIKGPQASMVMYGENAQKLNSVLHAINPDLAQQVIELGKVDSMLKVEEALTRGEFVGMLADRVIDGDGRIACDFFGEKAKFPDGPLRIAYILNRPVVLMVGLYRGGNRYDVFIERLVDMGDVPRSKRDAMLREALQTYAARLEHYCRLAPYNWFNFFDFWR